MKSLLTSVLAASLAACATYPTSMYVPVIDLSFPHDPQKYVFDIQQCNQFAQQRMTAAQGAATGAIVGALFGAALGAVAGGNSRFNAQMAGIGALSGGLGGAGQAFETQQAIVMRCMSARGWVVLG